MTQDTCIDYVLIYFGEDKQPRAIGGFSSQANGEAYARLLGIPMPYRVLPVGFPDEDGLVDESEAFSQDAFEDQE